MKIIIRLIGVGCAIGGMAYMPHDLYAGLALLTVGAIIEFLFYERENTK